MQGAEGDAPRPLKSLFRRVARWNFWCSRSILRGFGGTHLFIRQFLHQDGRDNHWFHQQLHKRLLSVLPA